MAQESYDFSNPGQVINNCWHIDNANIAPIPIVNEKEFELLDSLKTLPGLLLFACLNLVSVQTQMQSGVSPEANDSIGLLESRI